MAFPNAALTRRLLLGVLSVATVFAIYVWITNRPDNNPALLPPVSDIVASFFNNLRSGNLMTALGASLFRISLGFIVGTSLALVVGCLVSGGVRPFDDVL